MRMDFGPVVRAPRGHGPRTKKQARKLRARRAAAEQAHRPLPRRVREVDGPAPRPATDVISQFFQS